MSLAFSTALCFVLYELGFILARLEDFKKKKVWLLFCNRRENSFYANKLRLYLLSIYHDRTYHIPEKKRIVCI